MNGRWIDRLKSKMNSPAKRVAWLCAFVFCFYPSSTDRLGSIWFPLPVTGHDFTSGFAIVPLEEIFPGHSAEPEADVTRHALRIIEQHYVQRERLQPALMLSAAIKSLAREHGGDIELGFLKQSDDQVRIQLSNHRTIRLCPSSNRQSAEICADAGLVPLQSLSFDTSEAQVVLRVGFRVFGIPLSVEPGLKSLDLVGRFVIPEYARLRGVPVSLAIHTYLNGILDALDPHSSYMTRDEYRELRSGTRGQFGGVGLVVDEAQELPVIREVVPNSPAHMSGIRPGDILLKVGKNISAFRSLERVLRDVRELSPESAAPVWFFRPSSRRVYRSFLAREEIPTRSAELRVVEGHPEILHVRVTGFSNHTADDVYALFEHAQLSARGKLKMMLLDLRGNPGGLLDQAIQVSDLFIRKGRIVSTRSRFEEQVEQATRGTKIDLPLVVLVNSSSASASEIVAGALKDHGRALVVGERTFGKGSVQSLFELSTGTALKLTVAHYFTPAGQSLQGIGVVPHVSIKLVQPRDDHLWMSGSSELDREEHLASHLLNPVRSKPGQTALHEINLNMWVLANNQPQVFEGLRPLNFSYPLGDNTQSKTRLDDDPIARVGVSMGQLIYGVRSGTESLTEKSLREAFRRVAVDEAKLLKDSFEQLLRQADSVWRLLPRNFFDFTAEDRNALAGVNHSKNQKTPNLSLARPGKSPKANSGGSFREFLNFFSGVGNSVDSKAELPLLSTRVSLSANSLMGWQGNSNVILSLANNEIHTASQRNGTLVGLLGLKLDETHDGPSVWIPAVFGRSADRQMWVSSVRLPKAIRGYLSTLPTLAERADIVGQLKWKLGDDPLVLGQLQIPPVAKRHGTLTGQLTSRNGHQLLQVHYQRLGDSPPRVAAVPRHSEIELLIATLADDRVKVVTEVVPLQRIGDGEYRGETELQLNPVFTRGLGFGGMIGGIVRSAAGDVLTTSPLLWVGDDGVFPFQEVNSMKATNPLEW